VSQRQYEILFIAEQNLGEPEVDTLTATVKGFIEKENGTVEKAEVERRMRVTDGILRFLAVRIDAEMKKADRKKTIRGKKESTRRASVREKDRAFEGGAQ